MGEEARAAEALSDFCGEAREDALNTLELLIREGRLQRREQDLKPWLNLHLHTFHSFNYMKWSPARVVFEAWRTGLKYVGTVDFDTLAGLEETLLAGRLLGVEAASGFETRVFIGEWKDKVINSPMEPGIYYLCGKGFKSEPEQDSAAGRFFASIKDKSQRRNQKVLELLNSHLGEVHVDYRRDVLSLTPSGNPTERHIIEAYIKKASTVLGDNFNLFWARVFNLTEEEVRAAGQDAGVELQELLRKKLIKYGGPGYIPPESGSFPSFDEAVQMIESAGGVPTGTWLDGTNPGEEDPEAFVDFLEGKGIKAMTIIPERNYNISDPAEKKEKIKKLDEFMSVCRAKKMPVVCGTEMNKYGQPFVDDFNDPAISEYLDYFLSSASVFK